MTTCSPSVSTHVWVSYGDPSGIYSGDVPVSVAPPVPQPRREQLRYDDMFLESHDPHRDASSLSWLTIAKPTTAHILPTIEVIAMVTKQRYQR